MAHENAPLSHQNEKVNETHKKVVDEEHKGPSHGKAGKIESQNRNKSDLHKGRNRSRELQNVDQSKSENQIERDSESRDQNNQFIDNT